MSTVVRRGSPLSELSEWADSIWRPVAHVLGIRLEDHVDDDEYVVKAELPGLDPSKDIEITVHRRVLTIHAERESEERENGRSEFQYGTFERSVRLPEGSDEEKVKADYQDGILTVRTPYAIPSAEARKVDVSTK